MFESQRIFGLLLYKSWLNRKRYYFLLFIFEVLIPIVIFAYFRSINGPYNGSPQKLKEEAHYRAQSTQELIELATKNSRLNMQIFYAPNNSFVNDLMAKVDECFRNKATIKGFATENQFITFYLGSKDFRGIGVIFDEHVNRSSKNLDYKFRIMNSECSCKNDFSCSKIMPLYNDRASPINITEYYTVRYRLVQMQICLDRSFVKMKSGGITIPEIYIQRIPYPSYIQPIPFDRTFRRQHVMLLIYSFSVVLFFETLTPVNEKFAGGNVLMSMNGISNALNLLTWIINGTFFVSLFLGIPIILMLTHSPDYALPFVRYGNPIILFIVLFFYFAHLISYGIHVSAYFWKNYNAMGVLIFVNVLMTPAGTKPFTKNIPYLAPCLRLIFPNILFYDTMKEIGSYEFKAEGIQWYNLFTSADSLSNIRGSVGMFLISFMIGTIFHFILAAYVYAIKPGNYGVAKHPLYFLKCTCKKKRVKELDSLKYDETSDKYFETISTRDNVPTIQIRNLNKSFRIGLLSTQKVNALRDISVDFYKDQTTALFGYNGAGKTTMISILTGMMSPTTGIVLINSKNLYSNTSESMRDVGLGRQENLCFPTLNISEQLLLFARVKRKEKSRNEIRQDIDDLLEKLKMLGKRNSFLVMLSEGEKRRFSLCMALVGDPSILILDEPTSGADPESRRVIWNTLLKMRGQKTIVISTSDMEEAKILGDKIVILHEGQLKGYGTPIFLKRLIGPNNIQVTCSLEPQSNPERIRSELHKDGIIMSRDTNRTVFNIPYSPGLPDVLDNLEKNKKELGISGFSVSLISLEQVILTGSTNESYDSIKNSQDVHFHSQVEKLSGSALRKQTTGALLLKKLMYAIKNYSSIITKIFWVLIALLIDAMIFKRIEGFLKLEQKLVPISLAMYAKPNAFFTSHDKSLVDAYETVVRSFEGNPIEVNNTNLENALLQSGKDDLVFYDNYLIAAAEFNKSLVNAFYSEMATYSLPISINLISNTIAQNIFDHNHTISFSSHFLPPMLTCRSEKNSFSKPFSITVFCSILYSAVAMFVVHPNREFIRSLKQLQKMTGVSGFTYWSTMFFVDFIEYTFLVLLIIIGFVCTDLFFGLQIFGSTEIGIELLLLMLFGINVLPLIYIFSFVKKTKSCSAFILLIILPVPIVLIDRVVADYYNAHKYFRLIQKAIFLLVPYVSFLHSQISFFKTVQTNARCHWLPNEFYDSWCNNENQKDICCGLNCYDGKCKKSKSFFDNFDEDYSLTASTIYLCVTPILYFGILAVMENRLWSRRFRKITNHNSIESDFEEQLQREKTMISERIETLRGNNPSSINDDSTSENEAQNVDDQIFLVYELQKRYNKWEAVKGVSFGVHRGQCFGLLGTYKAGKSMTFRMMTGREIPDHGIMYILDKDFKNNEKHFLSQMGYCPQQDAILESLNSYDHLRLFARLRGIPKNHVEDEVQAWIDRLNLKTCALLPTKTYNRGNKRRLSIAIALIGNPILVLMDEPTIDVDPASQKSLWGVIKTCQIAGQAVVLSSHSMEECDNLCNKLAIMVKGKLVFIGASEQLKQRFSAGFDIVIRMDSEKSESEVDSIKNDMVRMLHCELTDENLCRLMYHVEPAGMTWKKMYNVMNEIENKYDCIDEFSIVSSPLERPFLKFIRTFLHAT